MKKLLLIFIVFLSLSTLYGCSPSSNLDGSLRLSKRQVERYNKKINDQLNALYWNYDESTTTFEKSTVETEQSPNYETVINACNDVDLDIKRYTGMEVVVAVTQLKHFNNEDAGKGYFYFMGNNLVGEYYIYNSKIYSLKNKNVFLTDVNFNSVEDTSVKGNFTESDVTIDFNDIKGIDDKGNIAVINDDYELWIYKFRKGKFVRAKQISYTNEGLYPMDISFSDQGAVVLLGKNDDVVKSNTNQTVEYQDEHTSDGDTYLLKSWRLVFLDKNFKKIRENINLDLSSYSDVNVIDGKIYLSRGNSIDVFETNDGGWVKSTQIMLKQSVSQIQFVDIDNNGTLEAVAIDGMDIFVYEIGETFSLVWRSHLSINSMTNSLYVEDLNGDGIKEIYIEDLAETTARYILSKDGFISNGEGIEYLQKYIIGDFNNDGKPDYIIKNNEDGSAKLYLGTE